MKAGKTVQVLCVDNKNTLEEKMQNHKSLNADMAFMTINGHQGLTSVIAVLNERVDVNLVVIDLEFSQLNSIQAESIIKSSIGREIEVIQSQELNEVEIADSLARYDASIKQNLKYS